MFRASILALVAGYADTIGYVHFHAFAGLMTGNTIFLGIELATRQLDRAAYHGAMIAAFLAGVICSRILLRLGARPWAALTAAAILLVVCDFVQKELAALLLAVAMGVQNSAANRFNGVALNTVFITGNLQKLGEELIHWLWPSRDTPRPRTDGVSIFALVWTAYAVGAVLGTWAGEAVSYPLLIPAALLPVVMIRGT